MQFVCVCVCVWGGGGGGGGGLRTWSQFNIPDCSKLQTYIPGIWFATWAHIGRD